MNRANARTDIPEPWSVAVGSMIALAAGVAPISLFGFSVLIKPLERVHGWDRAQISLAASLAALVIAFTVPLLGALFDRWGLRRVMVPAIILYAVNLAAIGLATTWPQFLSAVILTGVTGAVQTPVGYIKSVAAHFDERRGLAMGLAMSGTALGTAIVPVGLARLVDQFELAYAYPAMGLFVLVLALPVAIFLIKEPSRAHESGQPRSFHGGTTLAGALATRAFWLLVASSFIASTVLNGALIHSVPLLTDRGMSPAEAAAMVSAAGLTAFAGRLMTGFLVDRVFGPYVAAGVFVLATLGLHLLTQGTAPLAGLILIGFAIGAEVDLIGFLTSRYFGMAYFGRIFGVMFGIFGLGGAAGPYFAGATYVHFSDYEVAFSVFEGLLLLAVVLFLALGRYPVEATGSSG